MVHYFKFLTSFLEVDSLIRTWRITSAYANSLCDVSVKCSLDNALRYVTVRCDVTQNDIRHRFMSVSHFMLTSFPVVSPLGWTGVDMPTPNSTEAVPKIYANPAEILRGSNREGVGHFLSLIRRFSKYSE